MPFIKLNILLFTEKCPNIVESEFIFRLESAPLSCLFLCQHHTVLITAALIIHFNNWCCKCSLIIILMQKFLGKLSILILANNFRIILSSSRTKDFYGCVNFIDGFVQNCHILTISGQEWGNVPFVCFLLKLGFSSRRS